MGNRSGAIFPPAPGRQDNIRRAISCVLIGTLELACFLVTVYVIYV
jgi:hypothetical protein